MGSVKQKKTTRSVRKSPRRRSGAWIGALQNPWIWRGTAALSAIIIPCALWLQGYPQHLWERITDKTITMTGKVGYSLRDLYVQGRTYAPQDQLLKAIGLSQGEAILRFTPFELKERLEQITWIEEAVVQRRLPGTLYIKIRERQPVAFWQHNKKHFLVDPQGVILSCDNIKPFEGLPVIVGDDAPVHAPNILKVLSQYPEVRQQVTALVRVGGRRWDIAAIRTVAPAEESLLYKFQVRDAGVIR